MSRPKANPEQHTRAYRLWRGGKGQTDIWNALTEEFENPVSERTVATWIKGFKGLDPKTVNLDATFEWHQMNRYGLPWEASGYLMDVLYLREFTGGFYRAADKRSAKVDPPEVKVLPMPPLTVREAIWCWRVHLAAPEVGAEVGEPSDVLYLARGFAFREIAHEVLAEPLRLAGLDALLIYKPWLDFEEGDVRHQAYHRAVDEGIVPELPSGKDTMWKEREVFSEAAQGPQVDETLARVERAMTFTIIDYNVGHRELLESQQKELLFTKVGAREYWEQQRRATEEGINNDKA